ncbi:hypothetical protein BU15DRAFT_60640 [Melanogaster broomeanus]|nr:hypothetical protein BU15DRAFT_60640 [Melanogaster broomeanus]
MLCCKSCMWGPPRRTPGAWVSGGQHRFWLTKRCQPHCNAPATRPAPGHSVVLAVMCAVVLACKRARVASRLASSTRSDTGSDGVGSVRVRRRRRLRRKLQDKAISSTRTCSSRTGMQVCEGKAVRAARGQPSGLCKAQGSGAWAGTTLYLVSSRRSTEAIIDSEDAQTMETEIPRNETQNRNGQSTPDRSNWCTITDGNGLVETKYISEAKVCESPVESTAQPTNLIYGESMGPRGTCSLFDQFRPYPRRLTARSKTSMMTDGVEFTRRMHRWRGSVARVHSSVRVAMRNMKAWHHGMTGVCFVASAVAFLTQRMKGAHEQAVWWESCPFEVDGSSEEL